jgi:hypothetical protein
MTVRQYSIFDEPAILYVIERVHEAGLHEASMGFVVDNLRKWHSEGKRRQLVASSKGKVQT